MKRILILKIGAIGDVVMASTLLPFLKKEGPCHITWIVGDIAAPIIEKTGLVNRLIILNEKKLLNGGFWERFQEIAKLWKRLLFSSFDLVLCCHANIRYRLLLLPTRAKKRASFTHAGKRKIPVPGRYHAAEHIRLATGQDDSIRFTPEFPAIDAPLPKHLHLMPEPIILAPGGAKNVLAESHLRRWPVENYRKIAKHFVEKGYKILLIGAKSDDWTLPFFADIPHESFIGKIDLIELLAVLKKARLFITHDTGPMHIAKMAGCPTIALFGPTMPSSFVGKEPNIHVLWGGENLSCRPCYDGKQFAACQKALCMERISVEAVIKKAESLLFLDCPFVNSGSSL